MEIVNLNKQVYNKNQYVKVINTSFTQLIPTPVIEPALIVPTLQDFLIIIILSFSKYLNLETRILISILLTQVVIILGKIKIMKLYKH
jgi:hypothetical protein